MAKRIPYSAVVETIKFWQEKLNLKDIRINLDTAEATDANDFVSIIQDTAKESDRWSFRITASKEFWRNSTASERFYRIGHELIHIILWDMVDVIYFSKDDLEKDILEKMKRRLFMVDEKVALRLENVLRTLVPLPPEFQKLLSNQNKKESSE